MDVGQRLKAMFEFRPMDHLYRGEFYFWEETLTRWKSEGLPNDWQERNLFNFDIGHGLLGGAINLGWTDIPFLPMFEDKVIETRGDCEIIQDVCGRQLEVFRGRRNGFMPTYLKHAVSNMADWERVAPRLDPANPARWEGIAERARRNRAEADAANAMIIQHLIGGYMYLRALVGPEDLWYMVHDQPDVIHAAMRGWFNLMDAALARIQAEIEIDEIFMGEDICYNHGLLVSPDTVREFLFPYYQPLLQNARGRQKRKIYYEVDTDGDCRSAIPLYSEIGLTSMSPFEVASGCDVVAIAQQYPELIMHGGIDKRVLAAGKDAVEAHLQHIIPFMVDRGGYYPTCDHGVPPDVSLENYLYYRQRVCELDHKQ